MKTFKCQKCGDYYKIDLIVPDKIWSRISPKPNEDGLLCGSCIMWKIELLGDGSAAYNLEEI